jgi:hemolysin activation/secretion protein
MKQFFSHAVVALGMVLAMPAMAQTVPGAADASRIAPPSVPAPTLSAPAVSASGVVPTIAVPAGAESIFVTVKTLQMNGLTVFLAQDFEDITAPLIGKNVSLAAIYQLAAEVTQRYRQAGYLLSYAYVPNQEIADGNITLAIIEGSVERVVVEGDDPNAAITQQLVRWITDEKPSKERTIESALLRMNDLPGYGYRAVLNKPSPETPDKVVMTLIPKRKAPIASIGFDNFGSRFLGPNQINAMYLDSFFARHKTTLNVLNSMPTKKLNFGAMTHVYALTPTVNLDASTSFTRAQPGYTLTNLEVDSRSATISLGASYQWIRQRDENALVKLSFEARDVSSDVFGSTPLTRDDLRIVRGALSYDVSDGWNGLNTINGVITQGTQWFGASKKGDPNLSRSEAEPNFTKMEISIARQQYLAEDWRLMLQASGQVASGPLYASEEYGYGGQAYGRAYDASEIIGDEGASAMVELRYMGLRKLQPLNVEPFIFYDSGFVTNYDAGQKKRDTLSSAGGGVRFASIWGQSGVVGLAFPLTRSVAAPIYGQDADAPRIMMQMSHNF